jgi:hypothetical protein
MPKRNAKSQRANSKERNRNGTFSIELFPMGKNYAAPPKTVEVPTSLQVQEVSIYGDHSEQFEEFADSLAEDHDSMDCGMSDEACEDYELFDGDLDDSDNEFEVNKDSLMHIEKEIEAQELLKKRKL